MTVSVAMATYNGRRYVAEQLNSLAEQHQLPDELVVTDDASSDDTVAIVDAFASKAPFPVRIVRNAERVGYRRNFMCAAALCQSELIAFCDQDDIWNSQKLSICAASFSDPEVLLVYHNALTITADGQPLALLERLPAAPVTKPLEAHPMSHTRGFIQMFRRSLLRLSGFWEMSFDHKEIHCQERMAHDQWFFFLASVFGSIVWIDQILASYRQHGDNCYGWAAPSALQKLSWHVLPSLRGRAEEYAALEKGAGNRANILAQLSGTLTGAWQDRADVAAEKYRQLEHLYRSRRWLYEAHKAIDRTAAFWSILDRHGYRPKRDWGLGTKALLADLCLGLPAGHLLAKPRKSQLVR
jgi:glycosyltransferase involved in cell wall biosynthesis